MKLNIEDIEIWMQTEYPDYFVSNQGRLLKKRNNKYQIINYRVINGSYYWSIGVSPSSFEKYQYKKVSVKQLVADNFLERKKNKYKIINIDGDRTNNKVTNLKWVS